MVRQTRFSQNHLLGLKPVYCSIAPQRPPSSPLRKPTRLPIEIANSPGHATYAFSKLSGLYDALDSAYKLGVSLLDAPLEVFHKLTATLPRSTEAERLTIARVDQNVFRDAMLEYWNGRCPLTGITVPALLRASHIVPWAECESDDLRLDVHNGLLLSALWACAFDSRLISFSDTGTALR